MEQGSFEFKSPMLKGLELLTDNNAQYVDFQSFVDFVCDREPNILKKNLLRDLKASITKIHERDCLTVHACISFFYLKSRKHQFFSKICQSIEQLMVRNTGTVVEYGQSILDLYRKISKLNIYRAYEGHFEDKIKLSDLDSTTLITDHCDAFNEQEWKQICLFEHHFSQQSGVKDLSYDCQRQKRMEYFDTLIQLLTISSSLKDNAKASVTKRSYRQAAAAE